MNNERNSHENPALSAVRYSGGNCGKRLRWFETRHDEQGDEDDFRQRTTRAIQFLHGNGMGE
jgi:hypothetical protein